jgi:hypothetical protein
MAAERRAFAAARYSCAAVAVERRARTSLPVPMHAMQRGVGFARCERVNRLVVKPHAKHHRSSRSRCFHTNSRTVEERSASTSGDVGVSRAAPASICAAMTAVPSSSVRISSWPTVERERAECGARDTASASAGERSGRIVNTVVDTTRSFHGSVIKNKIHINCIKIVKY